jgi:hypothetical protein
MEASVKDLRSKIAFFDPPQWTVSKGQEKKESSISDKNFLSNGFLITSTYAFCTALTVLSYEILFNLFARNAIEKIRAKENKFYRMTAHCVHSPPGCPVCKFFSLFRT